VDHVKDQAPNEVRHTFQNKQTISQEELDNNSVRMVPRCMMKEMLWLLISTLPLHVLTADGQHRDDGARRAHGGDVVGGHMEEFVVCTAVDFHEIHFEFKPFWCREKDVPRPQGTTTCSHAWISHCSCLCTTSTGGGGYVGATEAIWV
jgi:hypothetical protein